VKRGELLAEFDKAPFEQQLREYRTDLERAAASLVRAEESLKAARARIEEDVKKAADNVVLAELELKDLEEGSGPLRVRKAKFLMESAKREYEKLQRDHADFTALVNEGYISQAELDSITHKMDEAKAAYEFTTADYEALLNFGGPTALETAKAKVRAAKESHDKLEETARYDHASREAEVTRARAEIATQRVKVSIAEYHLRNTEIYAPIDGFVIFPEVSIINTSERRKARIGDAVYPTEPFILIPDTSQMLVSTQIREVDIHKVKPGQEAVVRTDAYPDLVLTGNVAQIGTLAESKEAKGVGGKYFNLEIVLKDTDSRVRPGMTARVEIRVDEENDVLTVPVEAVLERRGRKLVYVASQGKVEEREIVTDKSNEDFMVVRTGLSPGEKVLLLDRTKGRPGAPRSDVP
jgi:HlyD family secretion protein